MFYKAAIVIISFLGLTGCCISTALPQAEDKNVLDTTQFTHAVVSGNPLPFNELQTGQIPEAVRCQPIWEEPSKNFPRYSTEFTGESQDLRLKTSCQTNDFYETLWEYRYENKSTGENWREYYINKQLIYRGQPGSDYNFYSKWIGRSLILFRSENQSGYFFIYNMAQKTIFLFCDRQWKSIPIDGGVITNDVWNYYDLSMPVRLGGVEETTGQIFFYVEHEFTTLFEYNPLRPNRVIVLLDHLPVKDSKLEFFGSGNLYQRKDGSVWFGVETGSDPVFSGLVFAYDAKSMVLTQMFTYSNSMHCYFYKECIAVHNWPDISLFDYNTNIVYPLEDSSQMYVITEIGPTGRECIKTYSESEKIHYLFDVPGNKRYYVTYNDMIQNFPDADRLTEGNRIAYLHGAGGFYLESGEDGRILQNGYNIDWYSAINFKVPE